VAIRRQHSPEAFEVDRQQRISRGLDASQGRQGNGRIGDARNAAPDGRRGEHHGEPPLGYRLQDGAEAGPLEVELDQCRTRQHDLEYLLQAADRAR